MNESKRPIVYWDCNDDAETLSHSEMDDAIEHFLDDSEQTDGTIMVYGYARMIVPKPAMGEEVELVDEWFERNWEEYIGEDGPDIPNSMYDAGLVFLTALHEQFVPWACEQVTAKEVNVAEWIKKNQPGWQNSK